MKGLDDLAAVRMRRLAPSTTMVEVAYEPRPYVAGTLQHRPGDPIPHDLRAVMGLRVIVAGRDNKAETIRVCEALDAAQAVVLGFYGDAISAGRMEAEELVFASDSWPT